MKKWLFSLVIFSFSLICQGQLNIATPDSSAMALATALLGNGISVSNATLSCGINAAGFFSQSTANIGISKGILLTNGAVGSSVFNYSQFNSHANYHDINDADLLSLDTAALYDVCELEFDFISTCDSLNFTYVFASEEYPSYVGTINDVFGIFLTGPKPSGGAYNAQNIALLPNGDPVTINTINSGMNPGYFVPNWPTCGCPHYKFGFRGFTVPVISKAALRQCQKYHIKIALADVLDHVYDSAVFLEANSFGCTNGPAVSVSTTPASCTHSGSAAVHASNIPGAATYQWLPGNQTTDSISALGPGTYTCLVSYNSLCGPFIQTFIATVIKSTNAAPVSAADTALCLGDTTHLVGPDSAISYHWVPSTGLDHSNIQSPIASPSTTTHYSVISTYPNGCTDTGQVRVNLYPLVAGLSASSYSGYEPFNVVLYNSSVGGSQYNWNFGNNNTLTSSANSLQQTYFAGNYTIVLAASNAHCADTASIVLHVETPLIIDVPNIFTPNDDGLNDEFYVKTNGLRKLEIEIYNRWGLLLFSSTDLSPSWNGRYNDKNVPEGTYFYIVKATDITGKEHLQKGSLALCR